MSDELAHLVGVIEDIRHPSNTRFMFPSKVGGKPAWLVPQELPEITCDTCKYRMTFLLQVYAPDSENDSAFHRSLLVFICLKCRWFLKCYRAQLPLENPFYPAQLVTAKDVPIEDSELDICCCEACGMPEHSSTLCRPLPEFGLAIEEIDEIDMNDEDQDDASDDEDAAECGEELQIQELPSDSGMSIDDSEMGLFEEFTDTALEQDNSFRMFKRFVDEAPGNHILYYSLGGSPIWISDEKQLSSNPDACEHCGSARRFEFQIQPQLIYHLMQRLKGFPMNAAPFEWGVVTIYTCASNCSVGPVYKEEFVFNQLEPSNWLEFDARKKMDFSKDNTVSKDAPKVMQSDDSDDGEWM